MNKAVVLAAVSASIVSASFADTKYSVANDASGQYSFRRANWKAAGDAAASAPASGNDYIAVHAINAGGLSSDTSTDAFPGDSLQIGEVGGTAGRMTVYKSGKVQVPNLILANGNMRCGNLDWTARFGAGTTAVLSPSTAPFVLGYPTTIAETSDGSMAFDAGHRFTGAETSGLCVNMSKATLTLKGGSPAYLGKWSFSPYRFMQVVLCSPDALGGNRATYAADAMSVSRHNLYMVLDFDGAMPSAGRGISIARNLVMNVTTGNVECTMPITRTGNTATLTVAGGAGALNTMGTSQEPTARDGFVSDGRDVLMLGTVAVPTTVNSGTLCVTNFTGGAFTLKSKARIAARIHRDGTADATSFAEGTALTVADAKIPLHVYGTFPFANATTRIAVLKIPASTRTVAVGDIELTADDFDLMGKALEVVTENGIQTVYLTMTGKVVYYSNYVSSANYAMPAQYWSDNKAVHGDADYLIGYDVPSSCFSIRGVENVPFGGKSLTMAPGTTFSTKGSASKPSTVSDMRCWAGSRITAGNSGVNVVTGNLSLRGNPANGGVTLSIEADDRSLRIDAGIAGSLPVKIQNWVNTYDDDTRTCEITSENPDFTGPVETSRYRTVNQGIRLVLHDELNLGGNPAEFNAAQLRFACKTVLEAADTFALDDPNRGLTVTAPCTFDVGSGKSLTLDIPMALSGFIAAGPMVKTGAGTLGIGGTVSGDSASLSVSEGYVRPVTRAGSSAVKYTFADGAGLELALLPSDADVAADGLYVIDSSHLTIQGSSLPVAVKGAIADDGKSVKLGIVNVPSAMANSVGSALGEQLAFTDDATGRIRRFPIQRETLDGGRVRFYADILRPATLMIFR